MALSKTKRRVFFYVSLLVFLAITPFLFLYSKGYTVSFKNRNFVKTGAIFLKSSNETGIKIFLDGLLYRETSFLSKGALVSDLAPGEHAIRVEKGGFVPWHKTLPVAEERVTEVRNILLLPDVAKTPAALFRASSSTNLSLISISPDESQTTVREKAKGTVRLVRTDSGATDGGDLVPGKNTLGVEWGEDSRQILLREFGGLFAVKDLTLAGAKSIFSVPETVFRKGPGAKSGTYKTVSASLNPANSSNIFVFDEAGVLSKLPLKSPATATVQDILENINSYSIAADSILVLFKNGFFAQTDLEGKNIATLGRKGAFISSTGMAKMGKSSNDEIFLIDELNGLFIARSEELEIEPVDGGVLGAEFSKDGKKLLYWKESELDIILLDDEQYQPFRVKNTHIKIPAPGERIAKAVWYGGDGEHVLTQTQNGLFVSDIDGRGGFFIKKLIQAPVENFFYSNRNQKLFWGDGTSIFSLPL
ncbi:MAG: hypothetical protein A3A28_05585 [Candidatus Sungbacteria bacterium RIFCSPLOWO2_01_FULL_47_32]|uniref:PEGA domain-containing protein n=1 Tax=Candidatus Sungbacteria bacterium RIFCSPHIGHO2_01_FULL_47_32 TaxID=1802264 RepID=A0A1G2K4R7_9BACT|nr:MAG: hypothetical protein UX72_C0001G0117 [Parcubacteria group bacterium GW2011_GWA2_47_10]OGZ94434.1 MAG: hypothetical protein A2633_04120 [Candidatus Sungbacteria bacterium RIFCSPHIGHO2_01_FULL_47_32]OGZ98026.1 MAG: hypothetical protein A3D57_02825 [Candidatus Sungbacteria bacterium RIFCSPHIGHO2_02_FULL_46_12]OHA05776.1 MAG: hypothetical protein A3A28_05585 [Candidatus Sungbacteria bacterium RIFCSPLOWO2_01_FULL_47_32]